LFESTPGEKIMSAEETWRRCIMLGPRFSEELKDLFSHFLREDDLESYNFIFPNRFSIRWEEEVDDLIMCKDPTYSDPDTLEFFRTICLDLLKNVRDLEEEIKFPDDDEILFERSTTTSYVHKLKKTMPHFQAAEACQEFNTTGLVGKRTVVPVYPGGVRDTIIADISANNSIRWIERSMRHILEYIPESAVTLFSSTSNRRREDVVFTRGYHVLRDIKKCGITYNTHDIFPIVRECLMNIFPDRRWSRINIFLDMTVIDKDTEYKAKRGYGLGMANHLVTFCNIVISHMCLSVMRSQEIPFKCKGIFGNDDADIVFYGKDRIYNPKNRSTEYLNLEHEIHGRLGNLTNIKKSVIKRHGLFYEEYSQPGWQNKESLVCGSLACAYLAPNIRVAKHYIYSQSGRFNSDWARDQLIKLAKSWGNEFFDVEDELKVHYQIGGWLNTSSFGLKTTLRDIDYLSDRYDEKLVKYAIQIFKEFVTPPRPMFSKPGIVNNYKYFGPAQKTDDRVQMYLLTEEDKFIYYKKLTSFQRNYSKRLKKFRKRVHKRDIEKPMNYFIKRFLSEEPWYAIPDSMVIEEDWSVEVRITPESESYKDTNDHIDDLINFYKGLDEDKPELDYKWNPPIPNEAFDYILETGLKSVLSCSQFSNSGFLPALEYYLTRRIYPVCKWICEVSLTPNLREIKTHPYLPSRRRYKVRKKSTQPQEIEVEEEYRYLSVNDMFDQVKEKDSDLDVNQFLKNMTTLILKEEEKEEFTKVAEEIDKFMSSHSDFTFSFDQDTSEYVNALDDDEGGGFFFFGEEE